jgi:hypothetical protein
LLMTTRYEKAGGGVSPGGKRKMAFGGAGKRPG